MEFHMNAWEYNLLRESLTLVDRHELEPAHVHHVALLATIIFDLTQSIHQQDPSARSILHSAALLHDIGWSQSSSGKGHHKVSAAMIRDFSWASIDRLTVKMIASVARYHRKSLPSTAHEDYTSLPQTHRATLEVLAGLLRIADGLDRSHRQRVHTICAAMEPSLIVLRIQGERGLAPEILGASRKKDLAERALGCPIIFEEETW